MEARQTGRDEPGTPNTPSSSSSTAPFPALTTIFTPPPQCMSRVLKTCSGNTCSVEVGSSLTCSEGTPGDYHVIRCRPDESLAFEDVITYSPGKFCPSGMTTAASAISPDGVWCCPTNLPWAGASPWCSTTLTKGTFQSFIGCDLETEFSAIAFGPRATQSFSFAQGLEVVGPGGTPETHFSTVTANTIKVVVSAKGVFLMGQTMAKEIDEGRVTANSASAPLPTTSITAPTASAVQPNTNQPISTTSGDDSPSSTPSKEVPIGAIVGGVIGGLILAGLLYFILSRRRKAQQNSQPTTTVIAHHENNYNPYDDDYKKVELDASARDPRSELEGTRVSTYGAGIYSQKAELEGTRGVNDVSAYVKNKVELEARHIHVAELEAIPYSVPAKEETPQSPTVKHEWSPTHRLG